ncbi:HlyD family type I secretion periplasmic adaptor subunit [Spiribacter roseus]|uniref:Membrane fusion protein (MFP) family protein n=1 Tax=Spiribacter roseus TaxID=1855875 RepID=A0ABV3RZE8_9GAMM
MIRRAGFSEFIDQYGAGRRARGSVLLLAIILLLCSAAIWAHLTEIDEVTRAQGTVVPSQNLQVIQTFEGGVIEKIRVSRGDQVDKGDVLMTLGGNLFEGSFAESQQRLNTLRARRLRLEAEISGQDLSFDDALVANAQEVVATEKALYAARRSELNAELRVLERQRLQREQELSGEQIATQVARQGIQLARSEREILAPLVAQDLEPELELLQIDQRLNDLEGQLEQTQSEITRLSSAVAEVEDRKNSVRERFKAEALAELADVTAEISELEEMLPVRQDQMERTRVRSPVDGTVNRVLFSTVGGVARQGDELLEVVPGDESLLVEARVLPTDIGFIYPGQPVRVMLSAYDFARYGSLKGQVEVIGADAIEEPQTGDVYYPVEIRTEGQLLDGDGEPLTVMPGMVADVSILSGKRTVLDYLIEPVVKVRETAFRDR